MSFPGDCWCESLLVSLAVSISSRQLRESVLLPGCWTCLAESSVKLALSQSDSRQSLLLVYTLLLREGPREAGQFQGFPEAIFNCLLPVLRCFLVE